MDLERGSSYNIKMVCVYVSHKCEIKIGDKVAGRYGNKASFPKFCLNTRWYGLQSIMSTIMDDCVQMFTW